jgi:hypothetical protein
MFCDLNLARRLERAEGEACARFVDARVRLFPQSGACRIEVAGTYAMFDGPQSPVTQTFGLGLFDEATPEAMDVLEDFFRSRSADVFHEVSPLTGPQVLALLTGRGYQPVELSSMMFRGLTGDDLPVEKRNERIRVRVVGKCDEDLWTKVGVRVWSTEAPDQVGYLREIGPVLTGREGAESFLVELDGEAIAAGALFLSGGVALLAGASTVPEGRGKGAQLALLDSRLRFARDHGCDLAVINTAPGSGSQGLGTT